MVDSKEKLNCYNCKNSSYFYNDYRSCDGAYSSCNCKLNRMNVLRDYENKTRHKDCPLSDVEIERCNHRDSKGTPTIEYDSSYEMRSSEMHCTQCGKEGTREELWNDENNKETIDIEKDYDLTEEYSDLLSGEILWLTSDELKCIMDNMNEIGINTLMVQTCKDKFVVKVDDLTIKEWGKRNAKI